MRLASWDTKYELHHKLPLDWETVLLFDCFPLWFDSLKYSSCSCELTTLTVIILSMYMCLYKTVHGHNFECN